MPTCSFFGWKSMKTKLGTSLPDSKWIKDSSTWPSDAKCFLLCASVHKKTKRETNSNKDTVFIFLLVRTKQTGQVGMKNAFYS